MPIVFHYYYGTKEGGLKAAATNKMKYGKDFYKIQGTKGGKLSRGGGFASNRELAVRAGRKGGFISRRSSDKNEVLPLEVRREQYRMGLYDSNR